MSDQLGLDSRTHEAVSELKAVISSRYPDARFELTRASDDPTNYNLVVTVENVDPDDVGDLVIERVVEMRVEESIPIHIMPIQSGHGFPRESPPVQRQAG